MLAPDGGEGVALLLATLARDAGACRIGPAPSRPEQE